MATDSKITEAIKIAKEKVCDDPNNAIMASNFITVFLNGLRANGQDKGKAEADYMLNGAILGYAMCILNNSVLEQENQDLKLQLSGKTNFHCTCGGLNDKLTIAVNALKKILAAEDAPPCYESDECPINDGVGFDNHCNENCPMVVAKQAINELQGGNNE